MADNEIRTLLTGCGLVESPRWHGDRLYFSDWSAGEVIAVDLAGRSGVVAHVKSLPLCTAWLPDGRLVIVRSGSSHRRRRARRGLAVTHLTQPPPATSAENVGPRLYHDPSWPKRAY